MFFFFIEDLIRFGSLISGISLEIRRESSHNTRARISSRDEFTSGVQLQRNIIEPCSISPQDPRRGRRGKGGREDEEKGVKEEVEKEEIRRWDPLTRVVGLLHEHELHRADMGGAKFTGSGQRERTSLMQ